MTTNESSTGRHRTEAVTGTVTGTARTRHDAGTPVDADVWRSLADASRQDLHAYRTLRSLRSRGAGA